MKKINFSKIKLKDIVNRYKNRESINYIAKSYDVDREVIERVLCENGIELDVKYSRRYIIDFSKIDETEKIAPDEHFVVIKDYPDFMVSNYGRVFNGKKKSFVEPRKYASSGFLPTAFLSKDGKGENKSIAKLVAEHFIPNTSKSFQVFPKDGNKENFYYRNLQWGGEAANLYSGSIIENVKLLERDFSREGIFWFVECLLCGRRKSIDGENLLAGHYKACGCLNGARHKGETGSKSMYWKGYGEISSTFFTRIKNTAKQRGLECSVSIEYLWNLFLKQDRKCIFSGLPLSFSSLTHKYDGTASVDRKNSLLGYIEGNVQWVHKDINFMKQDNIDLDFYNYCKLVYLNSKERFES